MWSGLKITGNLVLSRCSVESNRPYGGIAPKRRTDMKKWIMTAVFSLILLTLMSCGTEQAAETQEDAGQLQERSEESREQDMGAVGEDGEETDIQTVLPLSDTYLRITAGEYTAIFQLYDTEAAEELYDQLPLTLETSNFADAQWMFYPPEHLSVTEEEAYHDGKKGELSYYDPWGDAFFLYKDFQSGDEMHRLGICLEGMEELEEMSGTILVEKAEG